MEIFVQNCLCYQYKEFQVNLLVLPRDTRIEAD